MTQKKIWMRCLRIGVISIVYALLNGCDEGEIEHLLRVEFQFINNTSKTMTFNVYENIKTEEVKLAPSEYSKAITENASGGFKNPNPKSCCQGILEDTIGSNGGFYMLDNSLCVSHVKEKSDLIENYSHEVISKNHFRYTYVFTENDLINSKPCN